MHESCDCTARAVWLLGQKYQSTPGRPLIADEHRCYPVGVIVVAVERHVNSPDDVATAVGQSHERVMAFWLTWTWVATACVWSDVIVPSCRGPGHRKRCNRLVSRTRGPPSHLVLTEAAWLRARQNPTTRCAVSPGSTALRGNRPDDAVIGQN